MACSSRKASHAACHRARNQRENGLRLRNAEGPGAGGSGDRARRSRGRAAGEPARPRAARLAGARPQDAPVARDSRRASGPTCSTRALAPACAARYRRCAGRSGPDSERYLIAGRDDVGLAGDSEVWTDVADFERCVEQDRLEEALALCRGELLAGLDDDWVYERRDEHRDRVAGVLARLAADASKASETGSGDRLHAPPSGPRSARRRASAGSDAAACRRR